VSDPKAEPPYEPLEMYQVRLSGTHWESLSTEGHLHGWVAARQLGINKTDCDAIVDAAVKGVGGRIELWARQQEERRDKERVSVSQADLGQLLAVATLYVASFADDEAMTLPERLRFQEIQDIVTKYGERF
jgi:hypothetical protein